MSTSLEDFQADVLAGNNPYSNGSVGDLSWAGAFGNWIGDNKDWMSGLFNTAGQAYSIDQALSEANRVSDLGNFLNDWANQQGYMLNDASTFKGYGITSNMGTSTGSLDPETGAFTLDFGAMPNSTMATQGGTQRTAGGTAMNTAGSRYRDARQMVDGVNYMDPANTALQAAVADPSARQQEIYNQMMAIQNPELNRQQMAQQAREYAMGRGGVRGTQYGGTAEDAAMARARADASRVAVVDAMKQADSERSMFGQMGANFGNLYNQQGQLMKGIGDSYSELGLNRYKLGLGMEEMKYLPMKMQLEILQQAQNGVNSQQTGQLTGLGYLNDMLVGGMSTNVNSQKVASDLRANLYNALLSNLGGAQGSDGSSSSGLGGFLSAVEGGLGLLDKYIFNGDG